MSCPEWVLSPGRVHDLGECPAPNGCQHPPVRQPPAQCQRRVPSMTSPALVIH